MTRVACEDFITLLLAKFKEIDFNDFIVISNLVEIPDICIHGASMFENGNLFKKYVNYLMEQENFDKHLKKVLSKEKTTELYMYLDTIDIKEIVLRKIKNQGTIHKNEIENYNDLEIEAKDELFAMGALRMQWNDDIVYENYQEIVLSQLGEVYLYKRDNKDAIAYFSEKLQDSNCNVEMLDDFLMNQNLEVPADKLFTVDNFKTWCGLHDRYPFASEKVNTKAYKQ